MTGISALPPAKLAAHEAAVARLRDAYAAVPPGVPVRLAKPTSNLFRFRDSAKPGSADDRVSLRLVGVRNGRCREQDKQNREQAAKRHRSGWPPAGIIARRVLNVNRSCKRAQGRLV